MRQAKKRGAEVQRHGNKIIERTTNLVTEQAQNVSERAHNAVDNLQNTADRLQADPKSLGPRGANDVSIQPCRYFNTIFLWHSFQCFTELQF